MIKGMKILIAVLSQIYIILAGYPIHIPHTFFDHLQQPCQGH